MTNYNLKLINYLEQQEIKCKDFEDLYSELRAQELPLSLAGRLEDHFDKCNDCQTLAGEIEFIKEEAKYCFQAPEMPAAARRRLHQRLNQALGLNLSIS